MTKVQFVLLVSLFAFDARSQKFVSEKSTVTFYSKATIEDITAFNSNAVSLFNVESGEVAFSIPIRDFHFEKSLMQEHFNEKYMESEKFPKATFQGIISGYNQSVSGAQNAKASGKLTIHGVTKEIDTSGTLEFSNNKILLKSKFIVRLEDYSVPRPQLLWQNIAEQVDVTLEFTYKPYETK